MADRSGHRTVLVVGLGRFGFAVARELEELGHEVLAIDEREEVVQRIATEVTHAVIGDATDPELLRSLGVGDLTHAVVGIGDAQAGEDAKRSADREYARYAKVNKATAEVVAENEVRKELIEFLATKSVPLDGSLQVLRSLQALLPEDLWLDVVEVVPNKSAKGATKGQLIHVRGRGKEVSGKPINSVFQGFAAALKDKFKGIAEVKTPATPKGNEIQFDVFVDLLAGGAQPNGSDPEKAGGNGGSK